MLSAASSTGKAYRARNAYLIAYVCLLFATGTLNLACNSRMIQLEFIDNRNFPGGPNAWLLVFYSDGINTTGNAAYIVANFLAVGLLVRHLWPRIHLQRSLNSDLRLF